MLNIAPSDSLVDKLTSISDLNDLLVLDDKVFEPSASSYRTNLSISLNNNVCIAFLWYGGKWINKNKKIKKWCSWQFRKANKKASVSESLIKRIAG